MSTSPSRTSGSGSRKAALGAVSSTRIRLAAVATASLLPARSTEKYLMTWTPSPTLTVAPRVEAVVGVDPSVV